MNSNCKRIRDRAFIRSIVVLLVTAALMLPMFLLGCASNDEYLEMYNSKMELIKSEFLTDEVRSELGEAPIEDVGHAVFISVCDTTDRASVYCGTGKTLDDAFEKANKKAASGVRKKDLSSEWLKVDVVYKSQPTSAEVLAKRVYGSRHEFFRYGLSFDSDFDIALLEAEMNGAKIYEYENGGVSLSYLNTYLEKTGRRTLDALPEDYTLFMCKSWFCDADNAVMNLAEEGLEYGRRTAEIVDDVFVEGILSDATEFLLNQVKEDGSFVYGMYPRFDNDIENYNIVRHSSTIWSLVCRYRMNPDENLKKTIEKTIDYMLTQVIYSDDNTGFLYEEKDDEIKLGANGVAILAMTEYMEVFDSDKYVDVCRKIGNGILTMLDTSDGTYYHVLNGDFTEKEEFRTVYYDGEATFALSRLYGLTGEAVYLDAAEAAVDHFVEADYTQHKDHWVAYSVNEITKYLEKPEYYEFALRNVQVNLETIYERDTTYHTYLELLMVSFELYDRMVEKGISTEGLDKEFFLKTIYTRADRMLNGFFFPEYSMYMQNPARVTGTFMVRHDGYRIRIDDVQHNIGGYYLYYKNYSKLVEYGMLECRD